MIRVGSFFLVLVLAVTTPWWVFVTSIIAHTLYFSGIEVIFIAVLVDAYFFFPGNSLPLYTGLSVVLLVTSFLVRPYLFLYSRSE